MSLKPNKRAQKLVVPDALPSPAEPSMVSSSSRNGITKIEKSITDNALLTSPTTQARRGPGRPPRTTQPPVTWSVRGVTRDTRDALEQAAARSGKTLGQYLNEDIRTFARQQLQPVPEPSAAAMQEQIMYLRQLVENLAAMLSTQPGPVPSATATKPSSD